MTKVKAARGASKESFMHVKNASIHKKKQQKFKKTPVGKVALINGAQQKTNGTAKHQNGANSPKQKQSPKAALPKTNSPKSQKNSKKSPRTKVMVEDEQDDSSSDVDYNEGISIEEVVSAPDDDLDSSSDDGVAPNIFGTSLADETDEDDDEFDADSDDNDAKEAQENQGVKMFKGLKPKAEPEESSGADEDESEEEDDDDDDDDDDDVKPTVKDLLGDSIADESDDEDFVGDEDAEDSDEDDIEDSDEDVDQALNASTVTSGTDEDDEDDEEDDDDEDDDDDDDGSANISSLLGTTLDDETDDGDFEGDDDEEMSDDDDDEDEDEDEDDALPPAKKAKSVRAKKTDDDNNESIESTNSKSGKDAVPNPQQITKEQQQERDSRTIFVGNVPKDTTLAQIKSTFKEFGKIETLRMRGMIPENPQMPLKVAAIKKNFHPNSTTICFFVVYKNPESVEKALSMNGKKLGGNYLRVDRARTNVTKDKKRTVFLGNLPFAIEDNEIWETFKGCGRIESVRIIRDRKTGVGRGFGYVNFETVDGAILAMDLDGTTIKERQIRVKSNTPDGKKKIRTEKRQKKQLTKEAQGASPKKQKTEVLDPVAVATRNSVNATKRTDKKKRSQGQKQRVNSDSTSPQNKIPGKFQGQKADGKKKSKPDKSAKKKKQMAQKLLAKTKKPEKH